MSTNFSDFSVYTKFDSNVRHIQMSWHCHIPVHSIGLLIHLLINLNRQGNVTDIHIMLERHSTVSPLKTLCHTSVTI